MTDLLLIAGGVVLLVVANLLYHRQRDRDLAARLKQAGNDPARIMAELDTDIAMDEARADFWREQRGRPK